ncbi:2,5-diketo-D-gluconic acid reductase [Thomasclavelia spiroformis]|uniref:2,5-diketo-D-gluconic acid reductase n=1 Tax=Thomasclavelia spiroformis TaxID=29348 RepID=A0A1Y4QFK9_9FIRM|nr:aldo/keto reductase [Thomasclavelia spiroformis]OUQ03930.1 2,5-diketo-D-gluconic acid reductase [Thomasclavelia spiroformis]OUQ05104.1 2,5-diketo-D-gluconic acid reductase [Thomasclavelia spiroformis]
MEYIKLNNGVDIPILGYGTFQIPSSIAEECVLNALSVGYRMIDTAAAYFNEKEIGRAIKKSKISREEIFVVTKVWIQDAGYKNTMKAFYTSLKNLDLDYIDLYLIHQPYGDYYGSWKAMEELYRKGKIRAIGVCNFSMERFVDLYMNCTIKPMVNQIEFHPFFQQNQVQNLLKDYNCQIQAWGPLNEGQRNIFKHEILEEIAKKHDKTVAQIVLRWHIQKHIMTIPKTIHKDRMIENMNIWDFKLDSEDFKKIDQLNLGYSEIIDHQCYATAKNLNKYKIHE